MTAMCDEMREREMEDRKKIQHLLAMTQPVSQSVTYFKEEERRERVVMTSDLSLSRNGSGGRCGERERERERGEGKREREKKGKKNIHTSLSHSSPSLSLSHKQDPHVVRTIYMPNDSVERLKAVIESLRSQLAEQAKLSQDRNEALLEDRYVGG